VKTEKCLQTESIYEGRILSLHRDTVLVPNGKQAYREVVEHHGGVCVLPIDSEGNVYLVRQYRYPFGAELLEAPAGKLNQNEDPLTAGIRELKEETGFTAEKMEFVGLCYPSVGYTTEVIHLYLAYGLTAGETCPDEDEFLDLVTLPLHEAVKQVLDGDIPDAKTQIILLKAHAME
jgi:ADP-ribose pyrophosphatase